MADNLRTCLFRVSSPNSCSMPPEATGHGASIPLIPHSMAVVTLSYVRLNYADTGSHPLWQLWGLPPYFCRGPLCGDHDKFAAAFAKGEPIIDDVGLDVGAKPRRVARATSEMHDNTSHVSVIASGKAEFREIVDQ